MSDSHEDTKARRGERGMPEGWRSCRLGQIVTLQRGFDLPSGNRIEGIYPIYSSGGVTGFHNEYRAKAPGVVTGRYGSIGDVFYVEEDYWPLNTSLWVKDFHSNDALWVYYFLGRIDYKKFSDKTGVPGVNRNDLHSIKSLLPPLPEQRKIARVLSTWDKAIATTEKLLANSQQQKKALMQQLLTGKKRFPGFTEEWSLNKLGGIADIDKETLGQKTDADFSFKYISLSDVDKGHISKNLETHRFQNAPSRARRVVRNGDIVFATVRPNLQGFAKITKAHDGFVASTGFAVISAKNQFSSDYIYQYLFCSHVVGQIEAIVVGTNYPAINSSDVSALSIRVPSLPEQQKIASVLTAADKEIESLQQKLSQLKQEKAALMQQLLTGKRRVKVVE